MKLHFVPSIHLWLDKSEQIATSKHSLLLLLLNAVWHFPSPFNGWKLNYVVHVFFVVRLLVLRRRCFTLRTNAEKCYTHSLNQFCRSDSGSGFSGARIFHVWSGDSWQRSIILAAFLFCDVSLLSSIVYYYYYYTIRCLYQKRCMCVCMCMSFNKIHYVLPYSKGASYLIIYKSVGYKQQCLIRFLSNVEMRENIKHCYGLNR